MEVTTVGRPEPVKGDLIVIAAGRAVKLHDGEGRRCGTITLNKDTAGMIVGKVDEFDWDVFLPTMGQHAFVSRSAFEVV